MAEKVEEEILSEKTEILKELIPRMFDVMYMVAKSSCNYIKYGRLSSSWFDMC